MVQVQGKKLRTKEEEGAFWEDGKEVVGLHRRETERLGEI